MAVSGINGASNPLAALLASRVDAIQGVQGKPGNIGVSDRGMRDAELEELKQKNPDSSRLDFAKLTEADKLRAKLLKDQGVSDDSLAHMDPDQRAELEEGIRQKVADHVQQLTGKTVGGLANIVV